MDPCVIIIERRREKGEATLRRADGSQTITRAHAARCSIAGVSATEQRQQRMRIKDMRQELYMLLHTQGLDGLPRCSSLADFPGYRVRFTAKTYSLQEFRARESSARIGR